MTPTFWIAMLIILLAITLFVSAGIVIYHRVIYKFKNGLVARIHMPDTTVRHYRYDEMPANAKIIIKENNAKGEESSTEYFIKENCIEKGVWGKYIDYDYQVSEPINPQWRHTSTIDEIKELFRIVGALLDTDLHVKLLRNSKFEAFMRTIATITLIVCIIGACFSGVAMVKSFMHKSSDKVCELTLSNQTWQTIYIASHTIPPSTLPSSNTR